MTNQRQYSKLAAFIRPDYPETIHCTGISDPHMSGRRKEPQTDENKDVITVGEDMSVEAAADMFVKDNISCLPVLSSEKEIIGIITWRDILKNIDYRDKNDSSPASS